MTVTVDVDTKIYRRLDWMHAVWTDLDVAAWNVVATTGRCSPDQYSVMSAFSCSLLLLVHCDTSSILTCCLAVRWRRVVWLTPPIHLVSSAYR